jgi:predicted RNase H-like nuclease
LDDGTFHELGPPRIVDYAQAEGVILKWQAEQVPTATIVLLDQPTIVTNPEGQRPAENIVGSAVSLRYGGMQPANTSKKEMFGTEAPMWPFLTGFGGPTDPLEPVADTRVFETYPVLAMIALLWTLPDSRPAGRLLGSGRGQ